MNPALKSWRSVDPGDLFRERIKKFVTGPNEEVASNIRSESRSSQKLFIWTDNDREGEHIGFEVAEVARMGNSNLTTENIHRAVFNNIEASHIRQAARSSRPLDMNIVNAVLARMEIDFRIGAVLTRFQTLAIQRDIPQFRECVISYGSCQFPTLGFVVDQYNRVLRFVPEPFWYITVDAKMPQSFIDFQKAQEVEKSNGNCRKQKPQQSRYDVLTFKWARNRLFDRAATFVLFQKCIDSGTQARVHEVKKVPSSRWRPLPLTTVELQKVCSSRFRHLSAKQILDIAEKLYNKGFISYPRTETDVFDEAMDLRGLVEKQYISSEWGDYARKLLGQTQPPQRPTFTQPRKGKHNDKAHPPIHPVVYASRSALDSNDQWNIYEFICRRFLACVSPDAKGATTTVTLDWGEEFFSVSGIEVIERNFLEVYFPYQSWSSSSVQIPPGLFVQGSMVELASAEMLDGTTSAPKFLTEPELIALMDANGIGTDATMAEHIQTIIDRGYVNIANSSGDNGIRRLIPSALGFGLVEGYDKIGFDSSLSKPFLRKEMEESMVKIVNGLKTKEQVLQETIEQYFEVYMVAKRQEATLVNTTKNSLSTAQNTQNRGREPSRRGRGRSTTASRGR